MNEIVSRPYCMILFYLNSFALYNSLVNVRYDYSETCERMQKTYITREELFSDLNNFQYFLYGPWLL
jgi:hypothetical protein